MARRQNTKVLRYYPNEFYLFVCEDEKSMCYYLEGLKPYLKPNIKLEIKHSNNGTSASKVYECAEEEYKRINQNKYAYKKGFKVIACFDKDENDINDIKSIMDRKNKKSIPIYNNPCYEFWLYLHMQSNAPIFSSSADCAKRCMNRINRVYKTHFHSIDEMKRETKIFEIVKKGFVKAIDNAVSLKFTDYGKTYTNTQTVLAQIVDLEKIDK